MRILAAPIAFALLSGCAATTASPPNAMPAATDTYSVREGMVNLINPPATTIWDLQVEAMDDEGNFDPVRMDAPTWRSLSRAASALHAEAQRMANAQSYRAADPDGTLGPAPQGTDLAAIQARLTANEAGYRSFSRAFESQSADIVQAVEARNTQDLTRLVNDMQPTCKSCHDVFWYPEENE